MRRDLQYITVTGVGGINQQADLADPVRELAVAENVWAPNGKLIARPGYTGVLSTILDDYIGDVDCIFFKESPIGTWTAYNHFNGLLTGERIYLGILRSDLFSVLQGNFTSDCTSASHITNLQFYVTNHNANASKFYVEYYDGTNWCPTGALCVDKNTNKTTNFFLQQTSVTSNQDLMSCAFVPPKCWTDGAQSYTINSTAYTTYVWLRFTITDADFDATVSLFDSNDIAVYATLGPLTDSGFQAYTTHPVGLFRPQLSSYSTYAQVYDGIYTYNLHTARDAASAVDDLAGAFYITYEDLTRRDLKVNRLGALTVTSVPVTDRKLAEAATCAVMPQFDEYFLAYANRVTRHHQSVTSQTEITGTTFMDNVIATAETVSAQVETNEAFVGTDAPYADTYVDKLSEFPNASYILAHKGRLWVAGILSEPYTVRWSEPAPYHKVWATICFEYLMEDDNSPITGLAALGEHVVVFKRDSIWLMVDSGIDPETGLGMFSPIKVVSGVGCTAQSSIQQVRGTLIFLAEDGIYAFDGTPNLVKLSDRVTDLLEARAKPRDGNVASANWKTKSCYMLAFSTTGNLHNTVLVFDYKNNAWWKWTNIDARLFCVSEGAGDLEEVLFMDSFGHIYRLNDGLTDYGQLIDVSLKTQRINGGLARSRLRSIEIDSTNTTGSSLTLGAQTNDEETGLSATLDFTDDTELDWSDFSYASGATTDDNWSITRRRARRVATRREGDTFSVTLDHGQRDTLFECSGITVGLLPLGVR